MGYNLVKKKGVNMRQLNWFDVKKSGFGDVEKKILTKIVNNPDSDYVIFKKESQHEYFEIRSWDEKDIMKEFLGSGSYPVRDVAVEILYKEANEFISKGVKTYEVINDFFDNIYMYPNKYQKIKCFVSSENIEETMIVEVLVLEETLDFDIVQAAKTYYEGTHSFVKGKEFNYGKINVKLGGSKEKGEIY